MNSKNKIKLFVVDDDAIYLKLVEIEFLQYPDFKLETYSTGEICVRKFVTRSGSDHPGLSS
jgi:two-component system OmpR family response regulator